MSRLKSESEKQAYSRAHLGARAFLMMHYLFEVNRCWVKDLRLVGSTLSVHRQDVSKTYRNLLKDGLLDCSPRRIPQSPTVPACATGSLRPILPTSAILISWRILPGKASSG